MTDKTERLASFGAASLLPGMMYLYEKMTAIVEEVRLFLRQAQLDGLEIPAGAKRRGRPPKALLALATTLEKSETSHQRGGKSGWSGMTAAQRSEEMRRRQAVARQNILGAAGKSTSLQTTPPTATHPRDMNHPDHAAWAKKQKAASKKRWAALGPKEQKKRIARMVAGRANVKTVNGSGAALSA